jgi:UTP-glucose-1-phosphate uridylyltransferase
MRSAGEPTLVVLAAGIGSRYGGLKQMEPVGPHGEFIIDYSVYDALRAGFGGVVFVIREEIEEAFRQKIGRYVERWCETTYVFQRLDDLPPDFQVPPDRKKPWGTAHATLSCRHVVQTPFAVINADDFYGHTAYRALCEYLMNAQDRDGVYDYCMVGYLVENTLSDYGHVARGICTVDASGYLQGIHERTRIEKSGAGARYTQDGETWIEIPRGTPVSMNAWGFTPSVFSELESRFRQLLDQKQGDNLQAEFYLSEAVGALVREGRATVKVLPSDEPWFGITYQQDKARVQQALLDLVRQGVYPQNLREEAEALYRGGRSPRRGSPTR